MRTADPNDNLWLQEATGMNVNASDMIHNGNLALFLTMEDIVGLHGAT